jgi:hypothetical protein
MYLVSCILCMVRHRTHKKPTFPFPLVLNRQNTAMAQMLQTCNASSVFVSTGFRGLHPHRHWNVYLC